MKKRFRLCVFSLALAVIMAFAGCSARSAISADDFQKQAKSAGYTVASQTSDTSGAAKSFSATKSGTDIQILYYSFSADADAQNWYSSQKNGLSGTGKTIVDSDTYNKYTETVGDIYFLLVRMDNTVIICKTPSAKSGDANNFISSIKY